MARDSQNDIGWDPAPFPTLDALCWTPVAAGLWRQHELSDGTYDVQDLIEVLEFLEIKEENARRYADWQRSQES
jgi:hypothetical protein